MALTIKRETQFGDKWYVAVFQAVTMSQIGKTAVTFPLLGQAVQYNQKHPRMKLAFLI